MTAAWEEVNCAGKAGAFASYAEAARHARIIREQSGLPHRKRRRLPLLEPYRCPAGCGGWHLTPPNDHRRKVA